MELVLPQKIPSREPATMSLNRNPVRGMGKDERNVREGFSADPLLQAARFRIIYIPVDPRPCQL